MQPEHLRFGGGPAQTVLNPLVAAVVLLAVLLIFVVRRRLIIAPLLAAGILIPMDQVIVLGSFHFQMVRALIFFGWLRMMAIKNSSGLSIFAGGINAIDKAVILWSIFTAINVSILWSTSGAIVNELGALYTIFGIYFLLRFLIRDIRDIETAFVVLAYIAAVIAVVMTVEQATGRNPYALLGGFRSGQVGTLMERGTRFRAMACFSHPILAGTFGAITFPLFLGLWSRGRKHRLASVIGIVASTVITVAANSSTPVLAYCAVLLGMCLWPLRTKMRIIRWSIVIILVTLHLIMKAPVWALIARFDVVSGSSSYHRYFLLDQFIRHFKDWWLIGTTQNAQWGWDMWDLANQYVAVGELSGLLPLIFFLAIIVYGFRRVGRARKHSLCNKRDQRLLWILGVTMFANVVSFFGISYFDQTIIVWYAFLAMISVCPALSLRRASEQSKGVAFGVPHRNIEAVQTPVSGTAWASYSQSLG